jgi:hypothetical protein
MINERINFASENFAGVQEDMLESLIEANVSSVPPSLYQQLQT